MKPAMQASFMRLTHLLVLLQGLLGLGQLVARRVLGQQILFLGSHGGQLGGFGALTVVVWSCRSLSRSSRSSRGRIRQSSCRRHRVREAQECCAVTMLGPSLFIWATMRGGRWRGPSGHAFLANQRHPWWGSTQPGPLLNQAQSFHHWTDRDLEHGQSNNERRSLQPNSCSAAAHA